MEKKELIEQVKYVLDKIRPYLQSDGGDCEFVDINEDNVVLIKLLDNCSDCGISDVTLKLGIERAILDEVPGITAVEAV